MPASIAVKPSANKPKLLDEVRDIIRRRHYSIRTEQAYVDWIKRFILYHDKRHPRDMAQEEVTKFLTHLARDRNVAASTQNQALSALLFLYKDVLQQEIGWLENVERARRPAKMPVVCRAPRSRVHGANVISKVDCDAISRGKDVSTTMMYTHVVNKPGIGVKSPLD